jgi:hypothetical protein
MAWKHVDFIMSKSQKVGMTDDTWKFQAILTTLGQETHQKTCSRKHQPTEQSGLNQSATNEEVFLLIPRLEQFWIRQTTSMLRCV